MTLRDLAMEAGRPCLLSLLIEEARRPLMETEGKRLHRLGGGLSDQARRELVLSTGDVEVEQPRRVLREFRPVLLPGREVTREPQRVDVRRVFLEHHLRPPARLLHVAADLRIERLDEPRVLTPGDAGFDSRVDPALLDPEREDQKRRGGAERESADVRPESDGARLGQVGREPELADEPQRQDDERGKEEPESKPGQQDDRDAEESNARSPESNEKCAHDPGHVGHDRSETPRVLPGVGGERGAPRKKIEQREQDPPEDVFEKRAGREKEQHVADEMEDPGVDEHRGQRRKRVRVRRNEPRLQQRQLPADREEIASQRIQLLLLTADDPLDRRRRHLTGLLEELEGAVSVKGGELGRDRQIGIANQVFGDLFCLCLETRGYVGAHRGEPEEEKDEDVQGDDAVGDPRLPAHFGVLLSNRDDEHDAGQGYRARAAGMNWTLVLRLGSYFAGE